MSTKNLNIGDRVLVMVPGKWPQTGIIVDVDDAPIDPGFQPSQYQVRWGSDTPGGERTDWFDGRYVFPTKM